MGVLAVLAVPVVLALAFASYALACAWLSDRFLGHRPEHLAIYVVASYMLLIVPTFVLLLRAAGLQIRW